MMTACSLSVSLCLLVMSTTPQVDQPRVDRKVPAKEEKKRPTTPAEFEALAKQSPLPPWGLFSGREKQMVKEMCVRGTVVEVSADSIEILPVKRQETVKYPPHTLLATGAVCHWQWDGECYLLDDVKPGDEVDLSVGTVDKEKGPECFYVSIRKRPGGVIPPSRKPSDVKPYHKSRQRELDYEARGETLPEVIRAAEDKKKFMAEKGVGPPRPKAADSAPPKKKD